MTVPDLNLMSVAVGAAATVVTRDLLPRGLKWFLGVYKQRYIDPHKAQRQVLLDQAVWCEERAGKLTVFRFQLGQDPKVEKFKLAELVSKLDQHDRQWVVKQTDCCGPGGADVDILRKYAADKSAQCNENAGEYRRLAEEIEYKIFDL